MFKGGGGGGTSASAPFRQILPKTPHPYTVLPVLYYAWRNEWQSNEAAAGRRMVAARGRLQGTGLVEAVVGALHWHVPAADGICCSFTVIDGDILQFRRNRQEGGTCQCVTDGVCCSLL